MMGPSQGVIELIEELKAVRAVLSVDPRRRLKVRAPRGVLNDELSGRIAAFKPVLANLVRMSKCDKCRSTQFVDVEIHGGHSLRRDCARCGSFVGFPVWNPQE
ncbi:hypothetical protein [Bythopirellula polymerisocia]|uniref:TubC N-terminal docking domain-containing protein n=1 Tax=Bythopirellula polymerisocia TaxID=2528003 RepID=A0A5C6D1L7_9BACT|nr:hypothetical protein [Bythopirellula polymerisocia]TWU29651.1 hypothetical protein Pla144_04300 [Bythopirellula polymerisocia]